MASLSVRNPKEDWLISPKNAALVIIDYQPTQVNSINSMSRAQLVKNIVIVAEIAKIYGLPIILSTVNVKTGANKETIPSLKETLGGIPSYDRTSINAWEDKEFYEAVKATNRKKLIMVALWTEACLTFPTIDAIREGFEVYPVADAVGGTSVSAHETALRRIEQAGAKLTGIAQLACELQRDWSRKDTVPDFLKIMFEAGIFLKL
ncbi:MAG: hydrolase [Endomicrobia bacterium]|nr:hydrolase [Endomicrobiia bacterium]